MRVARFGAAVVVSITKRATRPFDPRNDKIQRVSQIARR